ncbi:MAG: hypothetical protein JST08_19080 [Actinobacteria bacterium]|nr:hypothetical protein [Actinomycetota bacterium]
MIRHRDLRLAVIVAVVCAGAALLVPIEWLSLVLLAPLAFFLTGHAISLAAFVKAPQPWPRSAWISVALSLAVLALLPLPLDVLGGLRPGTWALALVLVVIVACAIAAARRPDQWSGSSPALPRPPRPAPLTVALGLGALVLAGAAIALAHTTLSNGKAEGFTELWMRPGAGGAQVTIGVGSEEQRKTAYVVRAKFLGGATVTRSLVLAPGEVSSFHLAVSPRPGPGRPAFVSVLLFRRADLARPYRKVYGWVPAKAQE